jgi:phenylalanyl-tRNA synthetase alpha subunit
MRSLSHRHLQKLTEDDVPFCQEVVEKIYVLEKGANFTTTILKPETELTPEMLTSGTWRTATFKPYNFEALGISPAGGTLHPLLKVREVLDTVTYDVKHKGTVLRDGFQKY